MRCETVPLDVRLRNARAWQYLEDCRTRRIHRALRVAGGLVLVTVLAVAMAWPS